jgi:PrtD family type I secretion system ABC transporter
MPLFASTTGRDRVREALASCRSHFVAAAIFSAGSNILYLVPTIYMMQVYSRVIPTAGLTTLIALSVVALFGLATLATLDWLRGRLLVRAGAQIERVLAQRVFDAVTAPGLNRLDRAEAMRDLDTLRQAVTSPGVVALIDAPWAPVFIIVAGLLHPALGAFALVCAIVLFGLTWHHERKIAVPLARSNEALRAAYSRQQHLAAHAAEIRALGIGPALVRRQIADRAEATGLQANAAFSSGNHASLLRFLRLGFQSGALGLGAWLAVRGDISAGEVFAASLLVARAVAPVEQINAAWKSLLGAKAAHARLTGLLAADDPRPATALPAPTGAITAEHLTVLAPLSDRVVLADVGFAVAAGEIIGVVGASGAGKSTLLRTLSGATPPARGHVRFDGASAGDWDADALARHIGYLPQNFVLFPGTVKDNISRFRTDVGEDPTTVDAAAIAAAQAVGAHDMILRLPQGYDTEIGVGGIGLSAGQSQRIALARALYGNPSILLLDEPTAHLDTAAQQAFANTLGRLRTEKVTVLFATHSSDILAATDKLLLLRDGRVERFAPLGNAIPTFRPATYTPHSV